MHDGPQTALFSIREYVGSTSVESPDAAVLTITRVVVSTLLIRE